MRDLTTIDGTGLTEKQIAHLHKSADEMRAKNERKAAVIDLAEMGFPASAIAARLGLEMTRVDRIIWRAGV